MDRIGVVDTMFARYDMGAEAVDELKQCPGHGERFEVVRRTVPGFKDLGVACKKIIEEDRCAIVVALGMPGKAAIDQVCAHEASQGIMLAQLLTSTHVLEVFVHENEEEDPVRLAALQALPPQQRAAIVLRFYHGRDYEAIARILDTNVGTVGSWLSRGVTRLGRELAVDSTDFDRRHAEGTDVF